MKLVVKMFYAEDGFVNAFLFINGQVYKQIDFEEVGEVCSIWDLKPSAILI